MKNFNKVSLFFIKLLEILLLILFFVFLVFIVKWRIDHLYINSINNGEVNFTIKNEFKKTKMELLNLFGKSDEKYEIPVVKEKDTDTKKKESIIVNVPANTDVDSLGKILLANDIIESEQEYVRLMDEMGLKEKILPGNYEIRKDMKVKEILVEICGEEIRDINFTISEGANANDVGNLLLDMGVIESTDTFVKLCNDMNRTTFVPGEHKITLPLKVAKLIEEITV